MRWKEHFLVSIFHEKVQVTTFLLQEHFFFSNDVLQLIWLLYFIYSQVPDHTIKDINGASFAGFYYICFTKSKGKMEGYYYHRTSELFQSIELKHVPESCIQIYEFR